MKLFLSSQAIGPAHHEAFLRLVGKTKPEDISIALIENAADVAKEGDKPWLYENREMIKAHGFGVELIDLREHSKDQPLALRQRLQPHDVIWLGGGNTYYLRWILRESGADGVISSLVRQGKIYGGGSAGAIVAGPTLRHFEIADNPSEAPQHLEKGLGLTNVVVVPHWATPSYGGIMQTVNQNLRTDGYVTYCLGDDQALTIIDKDYTIIG